MYLFRKPIRSTGMGILGLAFFAIASMQAHGQKIQKNVNSENNPVQSSHTIQKNETEPVFRYTPHNTGANGISSPEIYEIYEDSKGRLYVLTAEGMDVRDGDQWHHLKIDDTDTLLRDIMEADNGHIWMATDNGLFEYDAALNRVNSVNMGNSDILNDDINAFDKDSAGNIWLGHPNGVTVFKPVEKRVVALYDSAEFNRANVTAVYHGKAGYVWMAVEKKSSPAENGIYRVDPVTDSTRIFTMGNSDLPFDKFSNITEDVSGNILARFDGKQWYYYGRKNGLADNRTIGLYTASDSTVWLGTRKGLTYYKNGMFHGNTQYGPYEQTIFEDSKDNIWFGGGNEGGILKYDGDSYNEYFDYIDSDNLTRKIASIKTITEGPFGFIYAVQKKQRGAMRFEGTQWTEFVVTIRDIQFVPVDIASDQVGNLWIADTDALYKWNGERWHRYEVPWISYDFLKIQSTSDGSIWAATVSRIHIFKNGNWRTLTVNGTVSVMHHAENGITWVGTDNGILGYNRNNLITAVNESGRIKTRKFRLKSNRPNPFNPTTTIEFSLPQTEEGELTIYNSIGQKVHTLINRNMAAGQHSANFDASHLPSGVYFYRLKAGEYSESRKMLLVK